MKRAIAFTDKYPIDAISNPIQIRHTITIEVTNPKTIKIVFSTCARANTKDYSTIGGLGKTSGTGIGDIKSGGEVISLRRRIIA